VSCRVVSRDSKQQKQRNKTSEPSLARAAASSLLTKDLCLIRYMRRHKPYGCEVKGCGKVC
jgi:hypothetical protein